MTKLEKSCLDKEFETLIPFLLLLMGGLGISIGLKHLFNLHFSLFWYLPMSIIGFVGLLYLSLFVKERFSK